MDGWDFQRFAEVEVSGSDSPLYRRLSLAIAEDPDILALRQYIQSGQPIPNMVFAAVRYLLEDYPDHPLTAYYPVLTRNLTIPDADPYPLFRAFALNHREQMIDLLQTRRVQTNEVRRCVAWLPAFGLVAELAGNRPLALVEIGASAGLNLFWDRYGYHYSNGATAGDPQAALQIDTVLQGDQAPALLASMPTINFRRGIDLNPVDITDTDALRWLRALVWAEHLDRLDMLDQAVAIALTNPPELVQGDVLAVLPSVCAAVPTDAALCLYHSFVVNQFPPPLRQQLTEVIEMVAREFEHCFRLSIEWLDSDNAPELRLAHYERGVMQSDRVLAYCSGHLRWLRWL